MAVHSWLAENSTSPSSIGVAGRRTARLSLQAPFLGDRPGCWATIRQLGRLGSVCLGLLHSAESIEQECFCADHLQKQMSTSLLDLTLTLECSAYVKIASISFHMYHCSGT